MMNVVNLFLDAANKYPLKPAIIKGHKSISFEELALDIKTRMRYYHSKGIKKGDRVLILTPMSQELYSIVLAVLGLGASAVFVDEWVSKKRLDECCKISKCNAMISTRKIRLLSFLVSGLRKIPIKLSTTYRKIVDEIKIAQIEPQYPALITFTTGSTGIPKAAIRTHQILSSQSNALINKLSLSDNDIVMSTLPIIVFLNLILGRTTVLSEANTKAIDKTEVHLLIKEMIKHQVSSLITSPKLLSRICQGLSRNIPLPITSIYTGGGPVFKEDAILYRKSFPETDITVVYGSTEAEPISAIGIDDIIDRDNTKGIPVGTIAKETNLLILPIDMDTSSISTEHELQQSKVPDNTIGEIAVSGDHVVRDYLGLAAEKCSNKIVTNKSYWHKTGDSGYVDSNGHLHLTGRCQSLIKIGQEQHSIFDIEQKLKSINGVEIGTAISHKQNVIATIQLAAGAQKESIENEISELDIHNIAYIDQIPMDPRHYSKIDYATLKLILNE